MDESRIPKVFITFFSRTTRHKKFKQYKVQGSPFIMLCLGFIELDRVISELCYKGIMF